MKRDAPQLIQTIAQTLFDKKGFNIIAIDMRNLSSMTEFYLIAEGNVERHVSAMAKAVKEIMQEAGQKPVGSEGLTEGDWVVLDYLEIVIHLMTPKMRDKYRLEELWGEGQIVELHLSEKAAQR